MGIVRLSMVCARDTMSWSYIKTFFVYSPCVVFGVVENVLAKKKAFIILCVLP